VRGSPSGGGREKEVLTTMEKAKGLKGKHFRIPMTVTQDMDSFLVKLGEDARAGGGHKLAKTEILRGVILFLMKIKLSLSGAKTEEDVTDRILQVVREKGK